MDGTDEGRRRNGVAGWHQRGQARSSGQPCRSTIASWDLGRSPVVTAATPTSARATLARSAGARAADPASADVWVHRAADRRRQPSLTWNRRVTDPGRGKTGVPQHPQQSQRCGVHRIVGHYLCPSRGNDPRCRRARCPGSRDGWEWDPAAAYCALQPSQTLASHARGTLMALGGRWHIDPSTRRAPPDWCPAAGRRARRPRSRWAAARRSAAGLPRRAACHDAAGFG